MYQMSSLC